MATMSIEPVGQTARTPYFGPQLSPVAEQIVEIVSRHVGGLYGLLPTEACRFANADMRADQKVYEVEILQAATRLHEMFPERADLQTWKIAVRGGFGYRVVEMKPCLPGQVRDEVTRRCVKPTQIPEAPPARIPEQEALPPPAEKPGIGGIAIVVAICLVFLVMSRK